jgi:hypothetical protein
VCACCAMLRARHGSVRACATAAQCHGGPVPRRPSAPAAQCHGGQVPRRPSATAGCSDPSAARARKAFCLCLSRRHLRTARAELAAGGYRVACECCEHSLAAYPSGRQHPPRRAIHSGAGVAAGAGAARVERRGGAGHTAPRRCHVPLGGPPRHTAAVMAPLPQTRTLRSGGSRAS